MVVTPGESHACSVVVRVTCVRMVRVRTVRAVRERKVLLRLNVACLPRGQPIKAERSECGPVKPGYLVAKRGACCDFTSRLKSELLPALARPMIATVGSLVAITVDIITEVE